jgi:transposase
MSQPLVCDELWNRIESILPTHEPDPRGGAPRKPDRPCLEGILHVLKTGCQWQRLPKCKLWPSGSTCWRRFDEWTTAGVWPQLHRFSSCQKDPIKKSAGGKGALPGRSNCLRIR